MQHLRHRKLSNRYKQLAAIAKRRNLEFDITLGEYLSLMKEQLCYYCEATLHSYTGPSVDRVDSAFGYIRGNLVPCCPECNNVKSNLLTASEMVYIIKFLRRKRHKPTGPVWPRRRKNGIQKRKQQRSV